MKTLRTSVALFGISVLHCVSTAPPSSQEGDAETSAVDASAEGAAANRVDSGASACVHDPAASEPIPSTASDTLPTGKCDTSQAACDLVVRQRCTCPYEGPSIRIYFHCACDHATWACTETDIDTSVCDQADSASCPSDAGTRID